MAPQRCTCNDVHVVAILRNTQLTALHLGALTCVGFCESDTRCAVLPNKIILDRKGKWADARLKGHSPFRTEACEKIALCHGTMCRRTFARAAFFGENHATLRPSAAAEHTIVYCWTANLCGYCNSMGIAIIALVRSRTRDLV